VTSNIAEGRPAVAAGGSAAELVSVIVPARNEEAHIEDCLRSILSQDHRDLEVIVVDGCSTDRTRAVVAALAAEDPRVRLVDNPRVSIPAALNVGLASATGRWLVRVDAHSTVPPDYVRRAVTWLGTGEWAGVGGRKNGLGETSAGRAIAVALGSRFGVGNSLYHHVAEVQETDHVPFGAYPTDIVRSMDGWDERLPANEDFEFDHRLRRAGGRLLLDPEMVVSWRSRQNVRDLFGQYHRYGRSKVAVALLHPSSVRPRHLAPPALVAWLALAAAVSPRRPAVAAAMAAPYAAGVAVAVRRTSAELEQPADRRWLPAAFVTMHLSWGLGFWAGVADRLRSWRDVRR
jgi:cellulose synthase/poly-beta-1,6-N-acetylglucosamine synthase-like glycosyltransferase